MSKKDLKPCPFCPDGGLPVPFERENHLGAVGRFVLCQKCYAEGPWVDPTDDEDTDYAKMCEHWNTRAPDLRAIDDILEGLSECIAQDLTEGNTHYLPGLQFAAGLVRSVRVRLTGNGA